MIIIGVLGEIGSGKSLVSKQFGYPVFNADNEVNKIYSKSLSCYKKLRKKFPKYIKKYPIDKKKLGRAILDNKKNLKKIVNIVHPIIRKEMKNFIKRNKKKKIVLLDVPLLIENKLNKKNYILIFVDAKRSEINLRLKKRLNYNRKLVSQFRKLQVPLSVKKKMSNYVIKNNFKLLTLKKRVKLIKNKILNERNSP